MKNKVKENMVQEFHTLWITDVRDTFLELLALVGSIYQGDASYSLL